MERVGIGTVVRLEKRTQSDLGTVFRARGRTCWEKPGGDGIQGGYVPAGFARAFAGTLP